MANPLQVNLTASERQALERLRDTAPKAYLRERAAALLKLADGLSALQVAAHGLLKPRKCDTVCDWVHRYQAEGLGGLTIRRGRGRKPAFSPRPARRRSGQDRAADGAA